MDTALDGAIKVFCERGYHATSIGDLTAAMRLATGSVYKAFRDKHAVFLAAFERYTAIRGEQTRAAAARGANGRERVRNVMLSYVEHSQGSEGRRGGMPRARHQYDTSPLCIIHLPLKSSGAPSGNPALTRRFRPLAG